MELLFNLIWTAAAATLWVLWAGGRRWRRKTSLLPAAGVQLIALAMLSAILLPVISITDDLQACHLPAEVQRAYDRNDRHSSIAKAPQSRHMAMALLAFCPRPSRLRAIALLQPSDSMPSLQIAFGRTLWSRPPPSA